MTTMLRRDEPHPRAWTLCQKPVQTFLDKASFNSLTQHSPGDSGVNTGLDQHGTFNHFPGRGRYSRRDYQDTLFLFSFFNFNVEHMTFRDVGKQNLR